MLPLLRYFRLARNCIAHRSSRASPALSDHSQDDGLQKAAKPLLDRNSKELPRFEVNGEVSWSLLTQSCARTFLGPLPRTAIRTLLARLELMVWCEPLLITSCLVIESCIRGPIGHLKLSLSSRPPAGTARAWDHQRTTIAVIKQLDIWKEFRSTFERKCAA